MEGLLVTLLSGTLAAVIEVVVQRLADRYWPVAVTV